MPDEYDGWAEDVDNDGDGQGPTNKEVREEIDRLLTIHRPERYDPSEKDWLEPIILQVQKMLRNRMTVDQIVRDDAARRVNTREDSAPRRLNSLLREITAQRQMPLGWGTPGWREVFSTELSLPIAIKRERQGTVIGRVRIRFGAMTLLDSIEWENAFRRDTERDMHARSETADGMVFLREIVEEQGASRFDEITVDEDEAP